MLDQATFEDALTTPRLRQPFPEYLVGNRGGRKVRILTEPELTAGTRQWFLDYERKVQHYAGHGIDISRTMERAKKYRWSWLMRDMSFDHELYASDIQYTGTSYGLFGGLLTVGVLPRGERPLFEDVLKTVKIISSIYSLDNKRKKPA